MNTTGEDVRTALSPYQYRSARDWHTYEGWSLMGNKLNPRKPNAAVAKVVELVEGGMSIREALREVPGSGMVEDSLGADRWSRLKYIERQNRMDQGPQLPHMSQRQLESLVALLTVGEEGDFDLLPPFRRGQHLVGKRHNYPA